MSVDLRLFNRQRGRAVNMGRLRSIVGWAIEQQADIKELDLTIHLVGGKSMAELNEKQLKHDGPTDVITLDYGCDSRAGRIAGEIFVCVDVAIEQAKEFGTKWQEELARYIIHGILHLRGYDDLRAPARRRMKREENKLLKAVMKKFPLTRLERK